MVMSGSSKSRRPRQLAHGPTVFWIQYGEGAAEKADRLQEILASSVDGLDRVAGAGRVGRAGELYIAPYMEPGEEEHYFYRARVEAVQGEMVTVFFIDYGKLALMPASCLLVVSRRLLQKLLGEAATEDIRSQQNHKERQQLT